MNDSDDDEPRLSATTLAALNEFYKEVEEKENKFKNSIAEETSNAIVFDENWQLSQFWYDEETIETLTKAAVGATQNDGKIALISCPTLYKRLKEIAGKRSVTLFEYDKRFSAFGADFIFYDYNAPSDVPNEMLLMYDLVIVDPPFLSPECLTKTAETVKLLTSKKIVLCTGAVMNDLAEEKLNVKKTNFLPRHKNNLANEFWCYTNFDFDKALQT